MVETGRTQTLVETLVETGRTHRHWLRQAEHTNIGRDRQNTQTLVETLVETGRTQTLVETLVETGRTHRHW